MAVEILLPKLGLTMEEGTIEEWVVQPGTHVHVGDVIMRIATDKVDVDVEAEAEGVFQPVAAAGATLAPGVLVGWLLGEGEPVPAGAAPPAPAAADSPAAPAPGPTPAPVAAAGNGGRLIASPNARRVAAELGVDLSTLRGTGPSGRIVSEDVEEAAAARPAAQEPVATRADQPAAPTSISPLVRRYASRLGVDLAGIRGTGLGGRISRADVDRAATGAAPAAGSPPQVTASAGDVIPLTGMRGAIARNMVASLREMAQLTHGFEVDVTELVSLRSQLKAEWSETGRRVPSLNDFVVRAAALALVDHPLLNATVRDDAVHLLDEVHVGVAVAVDAGLLVPVVRDAAERSLVELSTEIANLAAAARDGRLTLPQLEGATFAVTSLGSYGVDFFTPVINPGNVAILGVGRVKDGVRWDGEVPRRTQVLTLSLTFDHRAVDGAPAAEYLGTVGQLLARPLLLLAG